MNLLNVDKTFQWNVQNSLSLFKEFAWQVGDGIYYWYRVESEELPGSCYGLCSKTCFNEVLTVMATSVKGLARQLRAQRYNKPIGKVHKWTRPVLECDIKNFEAAGIDINCPSFIPVDYCIPAMYEFIPRGVDDCTSLQSQLETSALGCSTIPTTWYTQYNSVDPNPDLTVNDVVIKGEILGTIKDQVSTTSYLDFGLYDADSVSIPVSELFALPQIGNSIESTLSCLSSEQLERILATVYWPVDKDWCGWAEEANLVSHSGANINLMTWVCDPCAGYTTLSHIQTNPNPNLVVDPIKCTFVIGGGPPRPAEAAYVFCASGGSSVKSTVQTIGADYVKVKHIDVGPQCCKDEEIADAAPLSFFAGPIEQLKPMNNQVRTEVSGYLPMSLDIEMSLPQFGKDKLCYSVTSDSWQKVKHLQGGRCLCELSCRTHAGSSFWQLTFRMVKRDKRSEVVVTFFPNNFRQSGGYRCEFTLKNNVIESDVATQSVLVRDELGIFSSPVKFDIRA